MYNELPDIFNTQVISADLDVFWQEENLNSFSEKDTLIISEYYSPGSEEEGQLLKMLTACKLSPSDYQVVLLSPGESKAWHRLRSVTKPTKVLLLGIHPAQLGISALMQVNDINNFDGVQLVPTAPLSELLTNAPLKQHLWTSVFRILYPQ